MDYTPTFTEEELRIVKEALTEYLFLNEDGQDAFEYPRKREKARTLLRKLDNAYILEDR